QKHLVQTKCVKQVYILATIGILSNCRLPAHGNDMLELVRYVNIAIEEYQRNLLAYVGLTEATRKLQDARTSIVLRRTHENFNLEDANPHGGKTGFNIELLQELRSDVDRRFFANHFANQMLRLMRNPLVEHTVFLTDEVCVRHGHAGTVVTDGTEDEEEFKDKAKKVNTG
ncbi:unnamed protein product, partial [Amoebophrya sp. A25]